MKYSRRLWLLAAVAVLATGTPAMAGPITVDAGWYGFCFGGVFSPATAGCQNEGSGTEGNAFTFNATDDVVLKVTDAFQHGDTFLVLDFGAPVFVTSLVPVNPSNDLSNPDLAFADPTYSHGSTLLGVGAHSITIFAFASPFNHGGAYMEVETAVPEPTSLALLGGAMTALGAYRRRQRRG